MGVGREKSKEMNCWAVAEPMALWESLWHCGRACVAVCDGLSSGFHLSASSNYRLGLWFASVGSGGTVGP